MAEITEDTLLKDIAEKFPEAVLILAKQGIHVPCCVAEAWQTLGEVAKRRGIPLEPLLFELNRVVGTK